MEKRREEKRREEKRRVFIDDCKRRKKNANYRDIFNRKVQNERVT
jgi:hypothetical protein